MTDLAGKNVLITGAASGIGRMLADEVARRGARPLLVDLNTTALETACQELGGAGHECAVFSCDLSDRNQIAELGAKVLAGEGHVDVLINNAGIVTGKTLLEAEPEDIERTFAVNTLALFHMTRAILPSMLERGQGHVVTIASAGGIAGTARLVDYCSSKFAAIGFDESLRLEFKRLGKPLKTTVVCPFYIDTGMFEGVRTRFPLLLPILKPKPVVNKIIKAIERDRARLLMPWFVYTVYPMRLLPVSWQDALLSFLGINRS
ncbi:MAG: SDR family oxidoreductase, partial [Gammaproteobacteria bacterium]|nr:SDR family oxidoreductase [Gammaproteobacteria bacterium]